MRDVRNDNRRVPALRLEGFEGEWKEVPLGDHAKYAKGSGHSKKDLTSRDTPDSYPIVLYGRLYTRYQTEIEDLDTFAVPHNGAVLSLGGEVLVPSSGETEGDIARASVLRQRGAVIGGDLNIVFPDPTIDSTFLALTLSSGRASRSLSVKAQGKSVVHLKKGDLWSLEIARPAVAEQRAVARVVTTVERLVDTTSNQVSNLTSLKKTMLVKMFPQGTASTPEVRFEEFEGDWEVARLGDVAPLQRGFDLPWSDMRPGPYPVVGSNGVFASHDEHMANGPGVTLGRSGSVGRVSYIDSDYWPHNTCLWVTGFNGNDPQFIFRLFQHAKPERLASGSGVPTLNRNDVHAVGTRLPSLPEQQAIGSYFRSLDALIDAEQKKLDTLRNLKSALLTQMFI